MVHIHVPHSLHTPFLCDVVDPLLRDEGLRDDFFFLRYWQGGPHLRLRMLCGPGAGSAEAAERVVEGLARSMPEFEAEAREEYALGLTMQDELARLEREIPREGRPVGALDRVPYEPEYRKYGGPEGVEIAETVFRKSSAAVLDLLGRQPRAWVDARRAPIGEAARIMAMFLHGAGFDPEAAIAFLREYEDWWRAYAPEEMQSAWPKLYGSASAQLTNLCTAVWREGATDDVFHAMSVEATSRARSVCGADPDGDARDLRLDGTAYAGCLSNYVHTTNNRLGLVPAAEGLVAYLLRRALEELPR
ncbi:thiopeptide-type bacteriocin biosynthesis protein [Streptomyces sp. Je 1-79]|uniref:thiopeptide-type bacteriocin biosynthesis protein n=1 Tax=Streptomyces sp. Je 1-79 TaxID=2943847 RepID=UPI0021A79876|nr:thiopeptide-type bacteriocin biosynthesis protein [Streptomyces sp. Je 1-79]MCT4355814.1 thiopeptide-type bacteriocin biosynthesis protein [Streptomyces sp. Je 1-79]